MINGPDNETRTRLTSRGSQGEPLSLITGKESVEELRELIVDFSEACPAGQNHPHCPFRILSGLSYDSLEKLVKSMPRETCVAFFEQELKCRTQADLRCRNIVGNAFQKSPP